MIGLPKTTEFNKRIPKQKFYENMDISPDLKKIFIEQVKIIYWRNKIASTTTNLSKGTKVIELEIFEIRLNSQDLDERLLKQIDMVIPYHILFILEYQGKYKACIGYKEVATSGNKSFNISRYYYTKWLIGENLLLKFEGINVDAVYENFVRQIAGDNLNIKNVGESLKESILRDEHKSTLKNQIAKLQAKICNEKQLNKQIQMNTELKKIKKELEAM